MEAFFFFFQAEDGIRDYKVTGVQTCALPIFNRLRREDVPAVAAMGRGVIRLPDDKLENYLFANPYFPAEALDRKSTRLNSSHLVISYAVFCLKKKKQL